MSKREREPYENAPPRDASPGVLIVDRGGNIVDVSARAAEILGVAAGALIGSDVAQHLEAKAAGRLLHESDGKHVALLVESDSFAEAELLPAAPRAAVSNAMEELLARELDLLASVAGELGQEDLAKIAGHVLILNEGCVAATVALRSGPAFFRASRVELPAAELDALEAATLDRIADMLSIDPTRRVMDVEASPAAAKALSIALSRAKAFYSSERDLMGAVIVHYAEAVPLDTATERAFRIHARIAGIAVERLRLESIRRATETELREREQRLRLIVEATSDVVWDWDVQADRVWWSEGFRRRFGHGDATFSTWSDHVHPDDRERVTRLLWKTLSRYEPHWSEEYRFRKGDGSFSRVAHTATILYDQDGRATRVVSAMSDITEHHLVRTQLEQMKRVSSLGRLAATMAHEFNNVLMAIQPFTEVIRRSVKDNPRVTDATTRIFGAIQRGRKISDEILRFARRIDPIARAVPVRAWLEDFRAEAQALAGDVLTIHVDDVAEDLTILGDVSQLNQVLANLVLNARDASIAPADLHIRAQMSDEDAADGHSGMAHITVADSGIGMDAATLEHIFDPLFTTKKNGTGLGLAISHQVITKHGGRIRVESTPGVGTTFHLYIPTADGAPLEAARREEQRLPRRVLIVDDERNVADGIAQLLEAEGVTCVSVNRGDQAVRAIEDYGPDVVLLDIGLPDMSGIEVLREIRLRWPQLHVIFITGHFTRTDVDALLSEPHIGFLEKPFEFDELLTLLRRYAGGG